MSWEEDFVSNLAGMRMVDVFNPYADHCGTHDLPNAAEIRRSNLISILESRFESRVEAIWFGRDLGYRGGRRTGLALTDEVALLDEARAVQSGTKIARATHGAAVAERTAAVIWSVIRRLQFAPMLWNAFPFHPHEEGAEFTNRAHSVRERRATAWAIEALIERYGSPRLIAIGNDASKALTDLGFKHETSRHPSYGGQREFVETMERLHLLAPVLASQECLL